MITPLEAEINSQEETGMVIETMPSKEDEDQLTSEGTILMSEMRKEKEERDSEKATISEERKI